MARRRCGGHGELLVTSCKRVATKPADRASWHSVERDGDSARYVGRHGHANLLAGPDGCRCGGDCVVGALARVCVFFGCVFWLLAVCLRACFLDVSARVCAGAPAGLTKARNARADALVCSDAVVRSDTSNSMQWTCARSEHVLRASRRQGVQNISTATTRAICRTRAKIDYMYSRLLIQPERWAHVAT